MSCYLRHMGGIMEKAGVTPSNKEERRRVDRAVREIMEMPGAKCPEVWKKVKERLQHSDGEAELVSRLREKFVEAGPV